MPLRHSTTPAGERYSSPLTMYSSSLIDPDSGVIHCTVDYDEPMTYDRTAVCQSCGAPIGQGHTHCIRCRPQPHHTTPARQAVIQTARFLRHYRAGRLDEKVWP